MRKVADPQPVTGIVLHAERMDFGSSRCDLLALHLVYDRSGLVETGRTLRRLA